MAELVDPLSDLLVHLLLPLAQKMSLFHRFWVRLRGRVGLTVQISGIERNPQPSGSLSSRCRVHFGQHRISQPVGVGDNLFVKSAGFGKLGKEFFDSCDNLCLNI